MKIRGIFGLLAVAFLGGVCAAAPPPDTLTLADLINHPDRWPATVTVPRDFQFSNGAVVHAGDKAQVIKFDGRQVGLLVGKIRFLAAPQDCGFLDAANAAWSALSPAQRTVDPDSLPADPTLWPVRLALPAGMTCSFGKLAPGTEVSLLSISKQGPVIMFPNSANRVSTDFPSTDVISRARQLVLIDPDKRPSRVAAALVGIMVDADGKPFQDEHLGDKKFFAFYFGAGWCPPCQTFSPDLVKYADGALPRHPELAIVLLSRDHSLPEMLAYMQQEKMPFPAVAPNNVDQSGLLVSFTPDTQLIPHIVIVDRWGKVLASNADAQGNLTDAPAMLATLDKLLNSPPAQP